jgi:hypothetical protein
MFLIEKEEEQEEEHTQAFEMFRFLGCLFPMFPISLARVSAGELLPQEPLTFEGVFSSSARVRERKEEQEEQTGF